MQGHIICPKQHLPSRIPTQSRSVFVGQSTDRVLNHNRELPWGVQEVARVVLYLKKSCDRLWGERRDFLVLSSRTEATSSSHGDQIAFNWSNFKGGGLLKENGAALSGKHLSSLLFPTTRTRTTAGFFVVYVRHYRLWCERFLATKIMYQVINKKYRLVVLFASRR